MTREEYDKIRIAGTDDEYIMASNRYIKSLEQRITELESPKPCEGCNFEYYPNRFNALNTCKACYRSGITDYYEPKDTE